MSFLTWAFLWGGLAISLPVLFHLIRPTPKGSQQFSTLMFLRESPPRVSKRSRIDNWLLLLLRSAVVLLLALAFMRPFFRTGGEIFVSDLPGNRVALLVDRSASMQRGDLWQQVREEVNDVLDELKPGDEVALYAFDDRIRTLVGFPEERNIDLASRVQLVRNQFSTLKPSWRSTDLGNGLIAAADLVSEVEDKERSDTGMQIVLISDMQAGAETGSLQTYVWPKDVRVDVRKVEFAESTNATVRVLPDENAGPMDLGSRIRIANSTESKSDNFSVTWADPSGQDDEEARTPYYVPAGTSQVLRLPTSKNLTADRIVISGDDCDFDNQFFITNQSQQAVAIAYFGNDRPDDPDGSLYFLSRVVPESRARIVTVDQYPTDESVVWNDSQVPRLVVVTAPVSDGVADSLGKFVDGGGVLLAVVNQPEIFQSLAQLLPGISRMRDADTESEDYALLSSIDFSHRLFRSLSGPRFNDFTNIRFWKHLPLTVATGEDNTRPVASFDDNSLAIWQSNVGQGTVIGFSSSWRPDESQLALSSKFVPLITSVLGLAEREERVVNNWQVGDLFDLPDDSGAWRVIRPDGEVVNPEPSQRTVDVFEMPGVFQFANGNQQFDIAVNLAASESQTMPVDDVSLESLDVRIGTQPSREEIAGSLQKLKDTQLEGRQRIWKWLLVAAICLLVLETLIAGRRQSMSVVNEAATT